MNKLMDLRFLIGLFFLAVGLLLLAYYFLAGDSARQMTMVNLDCGFVYIGFGGLMLLLSLWKKTDEDKNGQGKD